MQMKFSEGFLFIFFIFCLSYLHVHVEKPRQVAPPLLLPQGPDDDAGRPVLGSVTMETTCLVVMFHTTDKLPDWIQSNILARIFNTDLISMYTMHMKSQAKQITRLLCTECLILLGINNV